MNSPFLYLHKRKLTLSRDSERYEEIASATQKKVGWKLFSALCLCKLYDLSSLPRPANQKMAMYTAFCIVVTATTIYRESSAQIELLTKLDENYKQQYEEYLQNSGFEAIH